MARGRPAGRSPAAADELRPLASTRKVLLLLAAAEAVERGTLDPDAAVELADVERWYAPGTDGGAHEAAVAELGETWTVDTALQAMIVFSDNAASDWVLDAVGGASAVDEVITDYGMVAQEPTWPLLGEFLAWGDRPDEWLAATDPTERQALVESLAADADGPVTITSWPLADPANAEVFSTFATKGGSLPGVITESTAIQAVGGEPLVVVQLHAGLPAEVEQTITSTFVHQALYAALATDPAFADEVAEVVGTAGRAP